MTLTTAVFVRDEIDRRDVFAEMNRLIGGTGGRWSESESTWSPGVWSIGNDVGQGFCALMWIEFKPDLPLRTEDESRAHDVDCDDDCDGSGFAHYPPCWLELRLDTTYSYRGPQGEGCGALHAKLLAQIGRWLDARGVSWGWQNEFSGERHFGDARYERLVDLVSGGVQAAAWFESQVRPFIEAEGGVIA